MTLARNDPYAVINRPSARTARVRAHICIRKCGCGRIGICAYQGALGMHGQAGVCAVLLAYASSRGPQLRHTGPSSIIAPAHHHRPGPSSCPQPIIISPAHHHRTGPSSCPQPIILPPAHHHRTSPSSSHGPSSWRLPAIMVRPAEQRRRCWRRSRASRRHARIGPDD